MLNVQCPGCSAPYSISEKRVPAGGMKMRCPKCGNSFNVAADGSVSTEGAAASPQPGGRALQSIGAPMPPRTKKPLFAPRPQSSDVSVDDLFQAAERGGDQKRAQTMVRGGQGAGPDAGFGVVDLGLPGSGDDLPPSDDGGMQDLPSPAQSSGFDDLPAMKGQGTFDDLPAPAGKGPASDFDDLPARTAIMQHPDDLPAPKARGQFDNLPAPRAEDDDIPQPTAVMRQPSPAKAKLPKPGQFDDLPSPAKYDHLPSPAKYDHLPSPAKFDNLPSPAKFDNLPSPSRFGDLPTPAGFGELPTPDGFGELPDLMGDLPSPAPFGNLPSVGGNLPAIGGNLPAIGGNLPAVGGNLPVIGGNLPNLGGSLPERAKFDHLPTKSGSLPVPRLDAPPVPPPPPPRTPAALDVDFPSGDFADDDQGTLAKPPDEMLSNDDELEAPKAPAPPPPRRQGGGVGDEFQVEEGPGASITQFTPEVGEAPPAPPVAGDNEAPLVKVKKKRKALRMMLAVVPMVAIAGGALSLTSMGPYGYYAISDALNRKEFDAQLAQFRATAREKLGGDVSADAQELVGQARAQQEIEPRFAPIASYTSFLAFLNSMRFGKQSEYDAVGKDLLDRIGSREPGLLLELGRAAKLASEGKYDDALARATELAEQNVEDIDAAALAGEIALIAKKNDDALARWGAAVKIEKTARTLYGLARAQLAAGKEKEAVATAEKVVAMSKAHAGSRTLIASTMWDRDASEAKAKALLEEVIDVKGKVRPVASTWELVRAYNMLGYLHLKHSRISAAEQTFGEALKIEPGSEDALIGNGELSYEAGRYADAMARYEAAKAANAESVAAAVGIAKVKLAQEMAKEALVDLQALAQKSEDPEVGYWLGRTFLALGKRDEAEKAYRKAIERGGKDRGVVHAYVALADLLLSRDKNDEAAKVLEDAAAKLPNNVELHYAKGDVALKAGRLDEATSEFGKALAIDDQNIASMFKLGVAHRRAREFDAAKAEYEKVGKVDANYPGLALEWGLWYGDNNQTEKALEMYTNALKKATDDVDLMLRVGSTQVLSGHAHEAVELLMTVYGRRRNSPEVNYFLGRAYLQQHEATKAMQYLQNAVHGEPQNAEYQLYYGWAAGEVDGQEVEAEQAIAHALELDKSLADAYWQRGLLAMRKGKFGDALSDLQTALDKKPTLYQAYAGIAECYEQQTQIDKAVQAWRKAIDGDDSVPEWHYRLAKRLEEKDKKTAEEHYLKAVEYMNLEMETKKVGSPLWLYDANYRLGEALRFRDKPRALKAFLDYMKLAPPDDVYRKDAEDAIHALGGRI